MVYPTDLTRALKWQPGTQVGDEAWKKIAAKKIEELEARLDAIAPKPKAVEPEKHIAADDEGNLYVADGPQSEKPVTGTVTVESGGETTVL